MSTQKVLTPCPARLFGEYGIYIMTEVYLIFNPVSLACLHATRRCHLTNLYGHVWFGTDLYGHLWFCTAWARFICTACLCFVRHSKLKQGQDFNFETTETQQPQHFNLISTKVENRSGYKPHINQGWNLVEILTLFERQDINLISTKVEIWSEY